jgi:hypothetical protein
MYNDSQEYINYLHQKKIILSTENCGCTTPLNTKVINPSQDWDKIVEEFNSNRVCVIDNFLYPEYALRLRNFFLTCNSREDYYEDYCALNFYKNKLWFSLLSNIIDEIQEHLSFTKDLGFQRAWAFIYSNQSKGIPVHADPASVSLNLWVTPEECMQIKEEHNGLDIWKIVSPKDWTHKDYNGNTKKITEYLQNDVKENNKVSIKYKFNRMTMFNSSCFHKTQPIIFKDGYENRRINYTFLYGAQQ